MSLQHNLLTYPKICVFIGTMNDATWFGGRNIPFFKKKCCHLVTMPLLRLNKNKILLIFLH